MRAPRHSDGSTHAATAAAARSTVEIASAADYFLVLERPVASEPARLVDRYPAADRADVSVDDKLALLLLCGFPPASAPARRDAEFFVIVMAHGGERSFGACLLSADGARLLCVLSRRPLYGLFRCFLSSIYHLVEPEGGGRRWAPHPLEHYIVNFVDETAAPKAGECVELELWDGSFTRYSVPLPLSLPHVDDLCFECLATHLAPEVVADLVIELLFEQSVVLLASRLGPLALVGEALLALLYPFQWCFPYIPVLPVQDSEHRVLLGMPVPALIGVDKALAAQLSPAFARRLNAKVSSFMYRYISRESCSQFDSLPLTSLTIFRLPQREDPRRRRCRNRGPPAAPEGRRGDAAAARLGARTARARAQRRVRAARSPGDDAHRAAAR
jgi:hypothetical protein